MKYEFKKDLIEAQMENEEAILREFQNGKYTIDKPLIKVNPYLVNPLSALMLFETEEEVAITICIRGKSKEGDIRASFAKAKRHIIPLVGLYNNYLNNIDVAIWQKAGQVYRHTIKIDDVLEGKDYVESIDTSYEYMQDNIMILTPAQDSYTIGVDVCGDVRLYFNEQFSWDIVQLNNGNIVISTAKLVRMPYFLSGLYEMSLCGRIYKEYHVPTGYHHDNYIMKDGNILALSCDYDNNTVEDRLVLISKEDGSILRQYNFSDFLPTDQGKSGSWSDEDWFHCNSVWYDENTNDIILSGRHMDAIVSIDFDSGQLNWIIGDPEGYSDEMKKYFFKPVGNSAEFDWQYEQHSVLITPHGEVMCFDNHHYGSKNPDKYLAAADSFSRGVKYKIDRDKMTIEQTWQYGKERGSEFYSPYICNVIYYNEGHYLVHSGGIAYDAEGNPSDHLGPYTSRNGGSIKSITVEVFEDKPLYELHAVGNFYRATKMKFYQESNKFDLSKPFTLGKLSATPESDVQIPAETTGQMLPDQYQARIVEEVDLFTFYGSFNKGDLVILVVENENDCHQYFISTAREERGAMCIGSFLGDSDRDVKAIVNKVDFKGSYDIRIILNDKKYETGVKIDF